MIPDQNTDGAENRQSGVSFFLEMVQVAIFSMVAPFLFLGSMLLLAVTIASFFYFLGFSLSHHPSPISNSWAVPSREDAHLGGK
jgi:hypothetical protein